MKRHIECHKLVRNSNPYGGRMKLISGVIDTRTLLVTFKSSNNVANHITLAMKKRFYMTFADWLLLHKALMNSERVDLQTVSSIRTIYHGE